MSLYRGSVSRLSEKGIFVSVPHLGVGIEFGPCEVTDAFLVGDKVLVSEIEDLKEDLVVVAKLFDAGDTVLNLDALVAALIQDELSLTHYALYGGPTPIATILDGGNAGTTSWEDEYDGGDATTESDDILDGGNAGSADIKDGGTAGTVVWSDTYDGGNANTEAVSIVDGGTA